MSRKELFNVKGMFCVNCERRISASLQALEGIEEVKASFQDSTVEAVWRPDVLDRNTIIQCIEAQGYSVTDSGFNLQMVSVLVILLALYLIASRLGWTNLFNIFPRVRSSVSMGMLFVIGVLTSIHCIAMCGGINLTQTTLSARRNEALLRSNLAYNIGRVISYTLIGCIAGGIGSVIAFNGILKGAAAVFAGIAMIIMALNMLGVFLPLRKLNLHLPEKIFPRVLRLHKGSSSFMIGLLNGLMPCGPLQSMQIYALSAGSILRGGLSMFLFSLGTIPLMFGFGLFTGRLNRKYAGYMLNVSAVLIFIMGFHMLENGFSLSGADLFPPRRENARMAMLSGPVQKISTEIDYGSYPPFIVRAGIPVEWTIIVPEGKLNGCNGEIIVPAFDLDIPLSEGENVVTFMPEKTGTVPYSCWMGMIKSSIEVTSQNR